MVKQEKQRVVLVIDDDALTREVMKDLLEKEGCLALEACDGLEGLQKIREAKPDIVFCDRLMPRMSGYALLQYLQEQVPGKKPEFVFLTSLTDTRDRDAVMDMNVSDYLAKPITPSTLRECLEHLREQASLRAPARAAD